MVGSRSVWERAKETVLEISGFFVPIFQFLPNTWMFMGLMSMPLIAYLSSLSYLPHLGREIWRMLFDFSFLFEWHGIQELAGVILVGTLVLLVRAMVIGGGVLFLYSSYYLYSFRDGLVDIGPYSKVRHPQYLGIVLMTGGMTIFTLGTDPVWVWAKGGATDLPSVSILVIWLLEILAYILLAEIEEIHLGAKLGDRYSRYARSVPFMIPVRF